MLQNWGLQINILVSFRWGKSEDWTALGLHFWIHWLAEKRRVAFWGWVGQALPSPWSWVHQTPALPSVPSQLGYWMLLPIRPGEKSRTSLIWHGKTRHQCIKMNSSAVLSYTIPQYVISDSLWNSTHHGERSGMQEAHPLVWQFLSEHGRATDMVLKGQNLLQAWIILQIISSGSNGTPIIFLHSSRQPLHYWRCRVASTNQILNLHLLSSTLVCSSSLFLAWMIASKSFLLRLSSSVRAWCCRNMADSHSGRTTQHLPFQPVPPAPSPSPNTLVIFVGSRNQWNRSATLRLSAFNKNSCVCTKLMKWQFQNSG